jgi:transcription initiation factor TFIID subunit 2
LKKNEYLTVRDFESDMRTIYNNCYTFNGLDHAFSKHAQVLESLLNREIRRINGESSGNSEMDKYVEVLDKLAYDDHYSLFASPVDPVILQIPTYLTVVKQPMDFSTIRDKIKKNVYANADQFLKDVILVFYNCYLFNQPGDPVTESGKKLEAKFNRLCSAAGLQTITVDMTKDNN